MKDEFDIYTKDMFGKQTSKPITDPDARQFSKTLSVQEEAPSRPPKKHREEAKEAPKKVSKPDMNMTARINDLQAKLDKGTPITKDQHTLLQKYGRGSVSTGPSGSGASLEKGMMGGRFKPTLHAKGGKVAGKLAKRGYGICKK
jgi:hypothetical protein